MFLLLFLCAVCLLGGLRRRAAGGEGDDARRYRSGRESETAPRDEIADRLYARDLDGLRYVFGRQLCEEALLEPLGARGELLRSWGPWRRDGYLE